MKATLMAANNNPRKTAVGISTIYFASKTAVGMLEDLREHLHCMAEKQQAKKKKVYTQENAVFT